MKHLVEAAYDYATQKTKFRKEVLKEVDDDNYVSRHTDCMVDFQCGSKWQEKQSPWISAKKRLPEYPCWVLVTGKEYKYRILFYCGGKFYTDKSLTSYDGSVLFWIPIPSLDKDL